MFFALSDGVDAHNIVMDLSGCTSWIEGDVDGLDQGDIEERVYTLKPVFMTQEEFDNLPESDI